MTKKLRIKHPVILNPQRPPNPPKRVLVAEGEPDIRRLNAEILACSGYQVDVADNWIVAWNACQLTHYDLIVTSHQLAQVSGLHLLKKLAEAGICLPVIMVTNILPPQEFTQTPWLRTTTLLCLPYTIETLLGIVKNLLHQTATIRPELAFLPAWKSQSITVGMQLV